MTQDAYRTLQLSNIDQAIALAQGLLKTSASLHRVCDTVDKKEENKNAASAFFQDSLMYFDFNDAVTELSSMPKELKAFKQKLIDIKVANSGMLMNGGYKEDVDKAICSIFAGDVLSNPETIEKEQLDRIKDAIDVLGDLKSVF